MLDTSRKCRLRRVQRIAACIVVMLGLAGCGGDGGAERSARAEAALEADENLPDTLRTGQALYGAMCASCHGTAGTGTEQGPPLVHEIYEPGHHADAAFYRAAEQGVRAHHWGFSDMPAIPDVGREEVGAIIEYIRWLQRETGIQ